MTHTVHQDAEHVIAEAIQNHQETLSLYGQGRGYTIPQTVQNIPGLRHLSVYGYYTDVPEWITDITTLESLELEEVRSVRTLVPTLSKLERLRKLKLAFVDDLESFPESLATLVHLEELNVDGADFGVFPKVIASLPKLQSFSWQYCDCALSEVFKTLSKLPNLRKLRLTHDPDNGEDEVIPQSFYHLPAIEELDFNDWSLLKELPENIGMMRSLRVINVSNPDHDVGYSADLDRLPDSLGDLCNLEELDLYGLENLRQLPPSFSKLSRLKRLDTMNSGIDELQLTPEQWANLEELRLHGPLPDLRQCINLKKFAWCKNSVGSFPNGQPYGVNETISLPLSPLCNLESLSITGGKLDSTEFLSFMPNLRALRLSCDFDIFPKGFERLNRLEYLDLWGAQSLTMLPEYLGDIPSLKRISLTSCGIKELPQSVRQRKDLHLDVRYSPIQQAG